MSNTVIEFNNVGKQYILGTIGTGTLSQDLNRWWANIRGKEDPYLKIGETNDRTKKGDSRFVWALRDINFKVEQGDVVGIVGKSLLYRHHCSQDMTSIGNAAPVHCRRSRR